MTIHSTFYSSRPEECLTPQAMFDELDAEFRFTLDPYATPKNAKCRHFYTQAQNGLEQDWGFHRVFCNPPCGMAMRKWAKKCLEASQAGALVVLLAHARTDTTWFHEYVYRHADLRFVRGRLKFGEAETSAPFPSLIAVYRPSPFVTSALTRNLPRPGDRNRNVNAIRCAIDMAK